jgi:two-component system nitrate/nitrite response regulator NarL
VESSKRSRPTTVLVADEHPLMLEALVRELEAAPGIAVVGMAASGVELVAQFEKHRPDVVLTDYWLPGHTGAQATRRIRAIEPSARVVFFSGSDDPRIAAACIEAGGIGFVPKTSDAGHLLSEIRAAAMKDPDSTAVTTAAVGGPSNDRLKNKLTSREREVLRLLSEGHTNGEIGGRLYLSPETVKTHVRRIYKKLGVSDRASAVRVALNQGLVE